MKLFFALFFLCVSSWAQYKTSAENKCDGFPQVQVGSLDKTCLGLVVDSSEGLKFPRKIVELEKNRFLITDMGGWSPPNRGALWELDLRGPQKKLTKRIGGLYLPHDLEFGPDENLYVGELGRIVRYSKQALLKGEMLTADVVVEGIPTNLQETNLHPLVNFAFGSGKNDKWSLYVNIGAPNDACAKDAPYRCSLEGKQGVVRKYSYQSGTNRWDKNFEVWAAGLRNSMGLVSHPSGLLLQVENSRDFRDENEPYDELNVIQKGKHYGWPYCYNFLATSPEWKDKVDCTRGFEPPHLLLPPHSAPLEVMYYQGNLFPELKNHILVSLHGYRSTGSRLVAIPVDMMGLPVAPMAGSWEYNAGTSVQKANPQGGNLRATQYTEVVSVWAKREGIRPSGTPVGLTVASDGAILIVEDKNKTILRLARTEKTQMPEENPQQIEMDKKVRAAKAVQKLNQNPQLLEAYKWINQNVFQTTCQGCHVQLNGPGTQAFEFMIRESWIKEGSSSSLLLRRLKGEDGLQKMPLGSVLSESTIQYVESFVKAL